MKIPALLAITAASVLTLSACGGSSSSTSVASDAGAGGQPTTRAVHVGTTSLGKVLVDGNGMTLYTLSADSRDHSTCSAQCLQFWPAVAPTDAGKLAVAAGKTSTPDGTATTTVAGQPVYTFSQDAKPGDVNGEGLNEFGGTWYAMSPTGKSIVPGAASTPSSGASTPAGAGPYGGGGY